jgi:hypothetical protein
VGDTAPGLPPDAGPFFLAFYGGHLYAFCDGPLSWKDAQNDCLVHGARLARIEDEQENLWIQATAYANVDPSNMRSSVWRWLGGTDDDVSGEWRWSDGTLFWLGGTSGSAQNGAYANWAAGHPSNNANLCAVMQHNTKAFWGSWDCATPQPYVCELY